ncbi:MAG: tetratricopeptide repeat protein [Gemmatimonadota bacterium]|nr:tetratricopeptide repeat protein [Gemmatimonadota bacterium]
MPILALGVLVIVSYLPAMLWGGFVWDDNTCIKVEPVREVSGLWQIWFSPSDIEREKHYWPLVYTTFWLEHKLWGFTPTGYHIINVLLHLANTLLVWHLVRRLAVPGAWVVAAVFAVHPLHVESVAWVIERKDVLSGLFYLAAVLTWMRFVEQPRPRYYVESLVLYAAGLLSKSIVITLPVALLIWHWWQQGRVTSTDLLRLVPFFAVGLVITVGDLSFYWSETTTSFDYSLTERTLIAARVLWFYVGKLLWPSELAVIYPLWDIRVADPLAWGYLVAAVALAVVLWHFRQQLGRGPLAGALFFMVTLSPVLGFVDYGYMQYAFVADRFQYLAGIGVIAVVISAVTYGVRHLSGLWQKGVLGVVAVALVVLGMLTWRQANIWRDDETLNRHIIALNPQARSAHLNLGSFLGRQGRYEEALKAARVAVAQRPDYFKAHVLLGGILGELGHFEEAETHLRRAIALNSQGSDARLNLGSTLYDQGRYEEALEVTRIAVVQRPDFFEAHVLLGKILNVLGHFEEAETHLRRAIALNSQDVNSPQYVNLFQELAEVLIPQGRYEEAIDLIAQAAGLNPASSQVAKLHFPKYTTVI